MQTETLTNGTKVLCSAVHRFGQDALLLARFAKVHCGAAVCDFGTGCGIVSLQLHDMGHRGVCVALDICPDAIALLQQSVQQNEIDHITPLCADLRTWKAPSTPSVFDAVLCNPPYFSSGILSQNAQRATARHETHCTLQEMCTAAAPLLRHGGKLIVCHRPERLADVLCAMRSVKLEPKRLQFVAQALDKAPWLVLVEAQKSRAAGLRVEPLLVP